MGYSAAAAAFRTLDLIGKLLDQHQPDRRGTNSFFDTEGRECFWETGRRESIVGAMTGSVHRETEPGSNRVLRAGSFKIDENGNVKSFPGLPKYIRDAIRTPEARRATAFELRRRETLAKLGGTLEQAWEATQAFAGDYQRETGTTFLFLPGCNVQAMYAFVKGLSL